MTSSSKYTLQLVNQQGSVEQTVHIDPTAAPARKLAPLRGQTGMRFNLFDDETLIGPQRLLARRDGYDLQLFLDGNAVTAADAATVQPDAVIADYYGTCAASELSVDESVGVESCSFFSGQEGSSFKYVPEQGGRARTMALLEPGDSGAFVVSPIAGAAPAGVVGLGGWALLAGAGLGLAGLAAAAGNDSNKVPLSVPNDVTVTDDVGTVTGIIEPGASTDDTRPTWTGRAGSTGAGYTVTLFDGSTAIGTTVAAADGSWSITPSTPLAEGAHTVTIAVADKDGNVMLDLSAIATHGDRITSVERIDLTGSGDNALRLTVADVLDIAGQNSFNAAAWSGLGATQSQHQLVVDGNAGDKLFTGAGWTLSATSVINESHVYHAYNAGAAQLLVDERVQVVA